jgi:hypothetical protein
MRAFDSLPRIAELSLDAARQVGSFALSVARRVAEPVINRRSDGAGSGWDRNWQPASSRPVGEPPPPPRAPRRPPATPPSPTAPRTPPAPAPPAAARAPAPAATPAAPAPAAVPTPPSPATATAPPPAPAVETAPARPASPPAATAEPVAPDHADRDAVLVAESADAGAADGAGAAIHVDEPWKGYAKLTVKDIAAQLATADPAMLAVVRLYESTHRKRRTLLADIDRRLAAADR